jgi:hypothetical protein
MDGILRGALIKSTQQNFRHTTIKLKLTYPSVATHSPKKRSEEPSNSLRITRQCDQMVFLQRL